MRFIKDYMNNTILRHKLNDLTQEVFGFNFEDWVQNGYYEGDYIPYSYEENDRLIANVSVNHMEFIQNGQKRYYIQLGTVMTKKEYRKQGYAKRLMEKVLEDYKENCDGIYLFGNLSAIEFYNKMGFLIGMQYRYTLKDDIRVMIQESAKKHNTEDCFKQIDTSKQLQKNRYMEAVRYSVINTALEQKNKYALQMFYTAGMENVYYSSKLDCYIVMERQESILYLQSIICTKKIRLEEILSYIQEEYTNLILGFTPCMEDTSLCISKIYDGEDDYRLFFYGEKLKDIETEKLYFPELSHA